jgi:hypothetical protein
MVAAHAILIVSALLAIPVGVCSRTHSRVYLNVLCPALTTILMVTLLVTLTWSFVDDRVIREAAFIARDGVVADERAASGDTDSPIEVLGNAEMAGVAFVQVLAIMTRRRQTQTASREVDHPSDNEAAR